MQRLVSRWNTPLLLCSPHDHSSAHSRAIDETFESRDHLSKTVSSNVSSFVYPTQGTEDSSPIVSRPDGFLVWVQVETAGPS